MRVMTRMWQMLLKALEEVAMAPNAMMAAEMAIIRLTHVADLPSPEDLVRKLQDETPPPSGGGGGGARTSGGSERSQASSHKGGNEGASQTSGVDASFRSGSAMGNGSVVALAQAPENALALYTRFEQVVELIRNSGKH